MPAGRARDAGRRRARELRFQIADLTVRRMTGLGIDIGGTSVKLAAVADGRVAWTARGRAHRRPSADELAGAIAEALAGRGADYDSVGVCVPGLMDDDRRTVRQSVNL